MKTIGSRFGKGDQYEGVYKTKWSCLKKKVKTKEVKTKEGQDRSTDKGGTIGSRFGKGDQLEGVYKTKWNCLKKKSNDKGATIGSTLNYSWCIYNYFV